MTPQAPSPIRANYRVRLPHVGKPDDLLTASEVADLLGVQLNTVTAWKARKQMPPPDQQYGRTPLWRRASIEAWHGKRHPKR